VSRPPTRPIAQEINLKIVQVTVDVLRVTVNNADVAAGRHVDATWHALARVETRMAS
jgi:hypothetical protein